jgi:hypothetical protein
LDGRPTFTVTDANFGGGLPAESRMHLALQLDQGCDDWIPCRTAATGPRVVMEVDWVRIRPLRS